MFCNLIFLSLIFDSLVHGILVTQHTYIEIHKTLVLWSYVFLIHVIHVHLELLFHCDKELYWCDC